jgi:large subunit ribosomal protein L17
MVTSLLEYGRIETTLPKAKAIRKWADKIISYGKHAHAAEKLATSLDAEGKKDLAAKKRAESLHNKRLSMQILRNLDSMRKVFSEYAQRYETRPGGYTRVIKSGFRVGDGAPLAVIEMMPDPDDAAAKAPKKKKK